MFVRKKEYMFFYGTEQLTQTTRHHCLSSACSQSRIRIIHEAGEAEASGRGPRNFSR